MGDVADGAGRPPRRARSYREDLAISERLAKTDPNNTGWLSNLAESYAMLAGVYRRSDDADGALAALRKGQAIMARRAKLSPGQRRLAAAAGVVRQSDRGFDEVSKLRSKAMCSVGAATGFCFCKE